MYLITAAMQEAMLAAFKTELDDGFVYVFAGPAPSSASAALDMVDLHTQVAQFTESADGSTGLTFEAPAAGLMTKDDTENWEGLVLFDGAQDALTTLTPTFFRFCKAGDTGRSASSASRLQGTVGGPSSGADMRLTAATVTANGTNKIGVAVFEVTQDLA